ncbi:MAG: trypsin-like cysteine/serine peptidase domain-containing protein [Piptocephalis tieghemiana]|nr:MAG: trypsin-like cysteine/serine peptidase domain-containing protein [Piptocephalis tieghemiana]
MQLPSPSSSSFLFHQKVPVQAGTVPPSKEEQPPHHHHSCGLFISLLGIRLCLLGSTGLLDLGLASSGRGTLPAAAQTVASPLSLYSFKEEAIVCGGAMINPDWFLTSAQCVRNGAVDQLSLVNFNRPQAKEHAGDSVAPLSHLPISQVRTHPKFNPQTLEHNVALLRLSQSAPKGEFPMIPAENPSVTPQTSLFATGWGLTTASAASASPSAILRPSQLEVLPKESCGAKGIPGKESFLCLRESSSTRPGTCGTLEASPIILSPTHQGLPPTLMGLYHSSAPQVTSFNNLCAQSTIIPNKVWPLSGSLNWISEITGSPISSFSAAVKPLNAKEPTKIPSPLGRNFIFGQE